MSSIFFRQVLVIRCRVIPMPFMRDYPLYWILRRCHRAVATTIFELLIARQLLYSELDKGRVIDSRCQRAVRAERSVSRGILRGMAVADRDL